MIRGTAPRMATGAAAALPAELQPFRITATLSDTMSLFTAVTVGCGSERLSSTRSSSLRPSTPPSLLSFSTATATPSRQPRSMLAR